MVKSIVLVHGYSVRSLDTYAKYPLLLRQSCEQIYLSAFDSLDNEITCDDLARALEVRIQRLEETKGLDVKQAAFICHSTGAIVTRRWILNRIRAGNENLPSHFVSMAGANQGSTLAQLGKTEWAQFGRQVFQHTPAGDGVLTDLDYGSRFLLDINKEWLEQTKKGMLDKVWSFSLVGDDNTANEKSFGPAGAIFWQVKEIGSDSTVRISGANLNYRVLELNQNADNPIPTVLSYDKPICHKILPGIAHTGEATGILDSVKEASDAPFKELMGALSVQDAGSYEQLQKRWSSENDKWYQGQKNLPSQNRKCNSTIVFNVSVPGGRTIDDFVVTILDQQGNARSVSSSIMPHEPIHNNVNKESVSFYVDYDDFHLLHPHGLSVEVHRSPQEIQFQSIENYVVPSELEALIKPNEFTYVNLILDEATYHVLDYDPDLDLTKQWPPLPKEQWWTKG